LLLSVSALNFCCIVAAEASRRFGRPAPATLEQLGWWFGTKKGFIGGTDETLLRELSGAQNLNLGSYGAMEGDYDRGMLP